MVDRLFSHEQIAKLKNVVNEGVAISQEIDDLNAGLNDTIKAVAEEMGVKPGILKKAIKVAQKGTFTDVNANHDEMINILEQVGRAQ